jgi:hypothetical protein
VTANGIILMFWGLHGLYIEGPRNLLNFSLGNGTTTLKTISVITFILSVQGPRHSSHNYLWGSFSHDYQKLIA